MPDKLIKNASPDWGGKRAGSGREKLDREPYFRQINPKWKPILDKVLKELRDNENPPR